MDYRQICNKVCEIARTTGEYIADQRKSFSFDKVEFKGIQDLVSYVDKTAEKMIVGELQQLLPDSGFITEEGTVSTQTKEFTWVIDPLDGTTNFVHGLPPYCVSIALMRGDSVVVGVVYEITQKDMFCAWEGSKSYLNGQEIRVSNTDKLKNSLVAVGFPYTDDMDAFLREVSFYHRNSNGVRRLGSAAADMVYLACGRFDAFSHVGLSPWDVAAAVLIIKCAGGVVTDYSGGENYIFGREIVATNPAVYNEFFATIK